MVSGMMMLLVKWQDKDTTQMTGMIHTLIMEEEVQVEEVEWPTLLKTHTPWKNTDITTTTCNLNKTEELTTTGDGENKK